MSFTWSDQQLEIFEEIANPTNSELAIRATAGASKTTSLTEAIARYKRIEPKASVRYLVFGNMASKEAKQAFSTNATVSTLHSFAYSYTVGGAYNLGTLKKYLTWMDIPKTVRRPFGKDPEILRIIDEYCLSGFLNVDSYVVSIEDDSFQFNLIPAVKQILNLMATGKMAITHSFYLKLFHILVMRGTIKLKPVDRLLIDEAQDMSAMALDIIQAIPATQKVLVGDQNQRIFSFMKLIDGFSRFPEAKVLHLSQSFRVDQSYAPAIQAFLRKHLESDAIFEGMVYPEDVKPVTKAYLTRTNASLIAKMIELNKCGTPYHLSSKLKLKHMFQLPLAVIYAKPGFAQKNPELKPFQEMVDSYGRLPQSTRERIGLYNYLLNLDNLDTATYSSIQLMFKFGKEDIIAASESAEEHQKTPCDLQLMTAHTSKGSTRDIIELDPDMDKAVKDALSKSFKGTEEDRRAELCLYFVSITRHRHKLINANYLKELYDDIIQNN